MTADIWAWQVGGRERTCSFGTEARLPTRAFSASISSISSRASSSTRAAACLSASSSCPRKAAYCRKWVSSACGGQVKSVSWER